MKLALHGLYENPSLLLMLPEQYVRGSLLNTCEIHDEVSNVFWVMFRLRYLFHK